MKIAVITDKSRMNFIPSEKAFKKDEQKEKTVEENKKDTRTHPCYKQKLLFKNF